MIEHKTRAAIAALPGKTVQPWRSGEKPCHCTHCDLCGDLYRTEDIGKHIDECQAALIKALEGEMEKPMDRRDEPITYGVLIDLLRKKSEGISRDNRFNDDEISRRAKSEDEQLVCDIASLLESHIEDDATDDANVRDMRRGVEALEAAHLAGAPTIVLDSVSKPNRRRFPNMRAIQREVGRWADEVDGVTAELHTTAAQTRTRFAAKLEVGITRIEALLAKMKEARGRI